ncbi:MAG: hypothetical protein WBD10_12895 [Acidobacteriaceae bacterium]
MDHILEDHISEMPADTLIEQAILALAAGDAATLRRLEAEAPRIAAPVSAAAFLRGADIFRALLDETGRNLRFLRRVLEKQPSALYSPSRH